MDQEQPAAGDAANQVHRNEAVEAANDFVMEAAAGTTAVSISRSEDQLPRQGGSAGNSPPRSGRVRTGATTASVAAATRGVSGSSDDEEDGPARDMREFDHYIKMQLQQLGGGSEVAPARASRDQRLTRVSSSIPLLPRRRAAAAAAGSAMAPARASLDRRLITRLQQQHPSPSSTEGGGSEVAPARESLDLELRL